METIELSGRTGQEVYEELKHRLEGMGYLPDELFSAGRRLGGQKGDPQGMRISFCHYGLRGQRGDLPGCVT